MVITFKNRQGVKQYLEKYVYSANDFKEYLNLLVNKKTEQLRRIECFEEQMTHHGREKK